MGRIEIQLPPEQANVLFEAIAAAFDAGRSWPDGGPGVSAESRTEGERETERERELSTAAWQV